MDAKALIREIDDLIRKVQGALEDPDTLSRAILELAVKNSLLGDVLAKATADEDEAKVNWKYKVEDRKLQLMASKEEKYATIAQAKAELENFAEGQAYYKAKKNVVLLKLKRESIDQIFEGGRSRLGVIKNDMRQVV